ncbi:MAG: diaminopimelate epimerase [Alphaproteobacteria bacterium]|nr:diaminopimelate epimerase [Alphaproteobacteria bacterium]
MEFKKMHGRGNDFVILDQRDGREALAPAQIQHICDRHFGVGCDQLIVMEPSEQADLFMRIYNPDASEAEACGNATRCVAHIYMSEQGREDCTIETLTGVLPARLVGENLVEVDMGAPISIQDTDLGPAMAYEPLLVNMGNPHCVFFVNDAEEIAIEHLGPTVENDEIFPGGTNVEFAHLQADGSIRVRVWERGAGVTLACGSGACAVFAAAISRGLVQDAADIQMDGGTLSMQFRAEDEHILMTGPVAYVFDGQLKS